MDRFREFSSAQLCGLWNSSRTLCYSNCSVRIPRSSIATVQGMASVFIQWMKASFPQTCAYQTSRTLLTAPSVLLFRAINCRNCTRKDISIHTMNEEIVSGKRAVHSQLCLLYSKCTVIPGHRLQLYRKGISIHTMNEGFVSANVCIPNFAYTLDSSKCTVIPFINCNCRRKDISIHTMNEEIVSAKRAVHTPNWIYFKTQPGLVVKFNIPHHKCVTSVINALRAHFRIGGHFVWADR